MNMSDTRDFEIASLPKKHVFFTDTQNFFLVVNEQDIKELSIHKIRIIDTAFSTQRENFLLQ